MTKTESEENMSEENIEMGTEVWNRNLDGPFEYIFFKDAMHWYYSNEDQTVYKDTKVFTTPRPHYQRPEYFDSLPPGCEVWEWDKAFKGYFNNGFNGVTMGHVIGKQVDNFRGFLYQVGDGSYFVESIHPVWTLPNSNSVWFGYQPDRIVAPLIGAVMLVAK